MQLFSPDALVFKKIYFCPRKHEKTALKIAHNLPKIFLVLPTGPKLAQISISVLHTQKSDDICECSLKEESGIMPKK